LYALAVITIAALVHVAVCLVMAMKRMDEGYGAAFAAYLLSPVIAAWAFGGTAVVIGFTSLFKIRQLSSGGAAVAEAMGGRRVSPQTQDFKERQYVNVVEEMAIASGMTVPQTYILDHEKGMNAFAAGFSTKDAAVAVTRGLLDTLNREELQAVVAHEFSHIQNGDMRLNVRLIGVLHGIFGLTIMGMMLFRVASMLSRTRGGSRGGSRQKDNGAAVAIAVFVLGLLIWLIGHLGYLFGRLIQSSVSRQREYLADASAVQFTRNPMGLANALKLIGAKGSRLENPKAVGMSHLFFASGLSGLFSTHPPLTKRIALWDASFSGDYSEALQQLSKRSGQ
jgi:Zn-dependent protease with chaperone function